MPPANRHFPLLLPEIYDNMVRGAAGAIAEACSHPGAERAPGHCSGWRTTDPEVLAMDFASWRITRVGT